MAGLFVPLSLAAQEPPAKSPREIVAEAAVLMDADEQRVLVESLATANADEVVSLLAKWREGEIYQWQDDEGNSVAVLLDGEPDGDEKFALVTLAAGKPVLAADGTAVRMTKDELYMADTDSKLRRVMKGVTDRLALSSPDVPKRLRAVQDTGLEQDLAKLPLLEQLTVVEKNGKVKQALAEATAMLKLRSEDMAVRETAVKELGAMGSIASQGAIKTVRDEADQGGLVSLVAACDQAQKEIDSHISFVNSAGTVFRGISKGSILLIAAIGLAITFGLMGVINMAHGELIVVGAYTTYMVQNLFAKWNLNGMAWDMYFLVAIPASFLTAALVGLILERGIIRFLYKRPLESLLATWGVSMVMQQLFRLTFGANNVQVESPAFLSGNWTVNDIVFGWNRVFVIGFAVLIIFLTWATLNKTSLGLLIRAVMQNRSMAACMGIRTERVNMMTFAFGSGLAGLAGAFLSQIGNVGPNLGQDYIVDSFMTVVVGGVGNIFGTVISALGIGMADQSLQQILGDPVTGKILVLGAIILFLQWKPSGLFATRSRSLD
ncbi:urea ABC transporter permease subunit UrtB [Luteolibacter flavescens]|uniref:Urea ABC transporter permease subunit UrtB n=1 Tax=Luteolibacter flavescens TaxID=1859460 RepID=A0ABT3FL98_9BACT|nr:urea ABC transporter permease subunit UrtB [Luteolibacter flavescens]MCW1884114.1 urea ABC transporter permease subunit UrtB [Luteolibacter flavescens]